MQREELTELLSSFESKCRVEDWTWRGWRVWPMVRTRLALALHGDAASGDPARGDPAGRPARLARSIAWRRQRARRWLGERVQSGADARADVVFLTGGDRAQRLGTRLTNTVVDPWAEAFAAAGSRVSVWSLGDPRWPTRVPHVSIQRAIDRDQTARASQPIGSAPDWFEELASWAADALDADLAWPNLAADLRAVMGASSVFEPWLQRARPRALVLDCWYRREALGAALAARRLGIPVIDLQHGIQGRGHPCYAGWSPTSEGRWEAFPDRFWVWGKWDAESLVASNPGAIAPEHVRVVGNRWLSDWVEASDPRHARACARAERLVAGRRAVLVTLQESVSFREELAALMRAAPRDWLWLVRLHRRAEAQPRPLQAELARATGRSVDAVGATRLPLYALMRSASVHLTAYSTCALEALAFGVPTLLTHESGEHAYGEFLADRVMWRHQSAPESARLLADDSEARAEACRTASRRVFAEPADVTTLLG